MAPSCYTEASKDPNWRPPMDKEINAHIRNGTWSLVPYEKWMNIIGSKWVFRVKQKPDGTIDVRKARLVAKGYNQREGFDYADTFSPVIKPSTIRLVLSIAVTHGWNMRQLDVQNAFLHGVLKEEVFMKQPSGYVDPDYPNHVCKLNKAIYGLKQAPRTWYSKLSTHLTSLGFKSSIADTSLFIRQSHNDITYVLIYVDDIVITGSNQSLINKLITDLNSAFAVTDLGELSYFLGVEVIKQGNCVLLSQQKYVSDLLKRTKMEGAKPVTTALVVNAKISR